VDHAHQGFGVVGQQSFGHGIDLGAGAGSGPDGPERRRGSGQFSFDSRRGPNYTGEAPQHPFPVGLGGFSMAEMIISKSRTKAASKECNVSSDFYDALDKKVREMIAHAEKRALANSRKTLRPYDL
jgi:hypothetical protein